MSDGSVLMTVIRVSHWKDEDLVDADEIINRTGRTEYQLAQLEDIARLAVATIRNEQAAEAQIPNDWITHTTSHAPEDSEGCSGCALEAVVTHRGRRSPGLSPPRDDLRKARVAVGLSMGDVARCLGVSVVLVSGVEIGTRQFTDDQLAEAWALLRDPGCVETAKAKRIDIGLPAGRRDGRWIKEDAGDE